MNLVLTRKIFNLYGIFGQLHTESGDLICYTLEHSYSNQPKLPPGTYTCVRGTHQLSGLNPFETFEITGVSGHTGILFHQGNWNRDSEGCVLVGSEIGAICILESRVAFQKLMALQTGIDQFILNVI